MGGRKVFDLTGKRFERLLVIERAGSSSNGGATWHCKCDCGKPMITRASRLKSGTTKSCGCYSRDNVAKRETTHGMSYTKIYRVWEGMIGRCYRPGAGPYKRYGARGITVCDEWRDFQTFYDWVKSSGYEEGLSIDRIDVNGDYSPSNCRWANPSEQANNRRTTKWVDVNGECMPMALAARKIGISYSAMQKRVKKEKQATGR